MRASPEIGCGLAVFAKYLQPREVANVLANTVRWVDPKAYQELPVWFPDTARKQPMFVNRWKRQQLNRGLPKTQGNEEANRALTQLMGVGRKERPNWTCCHIWGNDDQTFASTHSEVNDQRYFSCPANMVLVPTPLKAFTDAVPEVKVALRVAANQLYGFVPEGRDAPDAKDAGDWMPEGWSAGDDLAVVPLNRRIKAAIEGRAKAISKDYAERPNDYPIRKVTEVLEYWKEKMPNSLLPDPICEQIIANSQAKTPV